MLKCITRKKIRRVLLVFTLLALISIKFDRLQAQGCTNNLAPIATPNTRTINENSPIFTNTSGVGNANNLLTNDTDPEAGAISITSYTVAGQSGTPVVGTPFNVTGTFPDGHTGIIGIITINANGSYAFSFGPTAADDDFNGAFPTITYTITDPCGATASSTLNITVTPVEDCPDLQTGVWTFSEDQAGALTQPAFTDVDGPNGTGYSITMERNTNAGTATPASIFGVFTATSANGVTVTGSGTDYIIMQGNFNNLNNYISNPATAPVYIPVPDQNQNSGCGPIIQVYTRIYQAGTANPTPPPGPGAPTFSGCDERNRNLNYSSLADSYNYTVNACTNRTSAFNVLTATGTVNGTPSNFESPAGATITAINGAAYTNPIVLTNGQLTVSANGDISFVPNAGWTSGNQTFTYTATPGTGCAETRTVTLTPTTGCTTLPVVLVSFTGSVTNCSATLQWQTASEINFDRFEVEQSADGIRFEETGEVSSARLETGSRYSFKTTASQNGQYYRLKMIDIDNQFYYSEALSLRSNCSQASFTISPNPVQNIVNITGTSKGDLISLYNGTGKLVLNTNADGSSRTMNLSGLAPGIYVIAIYRKDEKLMTKKIIKR